MLRSPNHLLWKSAAVLFSGLCWYLSEGLSGQFWFLLWIAPITILVTAYRSAPRLAFGLSFLAYLLGRMSWIPYLLLVVPPVLVIIFTFSLPLAFAAVVSLSRRLVLKYNSWWVVFAFPVAWTGFEFLFFLLSRDGTAGSIAYNQASVLPLIQIASLTGITGITFLVTLFPSAVALIWYQGDRRKALLQFVSVGLIEILVFSFGYSRLATIDHQKMIKVALITEDENLHEETDRPDLPSENELAGKYLTAVAKAARENHAQLALLPEKAFTVPAAEFDAFIKQFRDTAQSAHVAIVFGITQLNNANNKKNLALVFSPGGKLLTTYNKVNLYEGELENGFEPGNISEGYRFKNLPMGVAICKDMDYDSYIRQYRNVQLMTIPAWDFVKDDWLHSRMAIIRSVEEGFSMVRAARQGRLTINDRYGRVLAEKNSSNGNPCVLIGEVPVAPTPLTFYGRFGGWFGGVILVVLIFFMFLIIRTPRTEEGAEEETP